MKETKGDLKHFFFQENEIENSDSLCKLDDDYIPDKKECDKVHTFLFHSDNSIRNFEKFLNCSRNVSFHVSAKLLRWF